MGYKRKIFNDKMVVAAAAVGVIAVSAVVGGVMLNSGNDNDTAIVELDDGLGSSLAEKEPEDSSQNYAKLQDDKEHKQNVENQTTEILNGTKNDGSEGVEVESEKNEIEQKADNDDVNKDIQMAEGNEEESSVSEQTEDVNVSDGILGLNFSQSSTLIWPVEGNVIIDFDMENTVYFATLDLYKCSDAVCVQSAVDTPVYAGSTCSIESVDYDSEIGNNVTVSMGNGYMLTYGQLKDVQVESGQVLEEGDLIGYVGAPTKYYAVEGAHLYMKMTQNGTPVDPLDYLNYE